MKLIVFLMVLFQTPALWAFEVYEHTLSNGITAYIVPDHRAPVAVNFVWYPIGAADEVSGSTGIAHMLEHLMFKGTADMPGQDFSKIVARHGGQDNAFTSYDYTAYYQKIGVQHLEKMMAMEASRMRGLTFGPAEFDSEQGVVIEERRQRTDNNPSARFHEKLRYHHMPTHPYGRPVIGWMRDIENYTTAKARGWYDRYYQPGRAIVIIMGDITPAAALPMLERTYGALPVAPVTPRPSWPVEPLWQETKWLKEVDPAVKVPSATIIYRAPSYFAGIAGDTVPESDILPLALLARVLGGGQTGILYQQLVKERQLADGAAASYYALMRSETRFDMTLTPKPGVPLSALHQAYDEVLADFLADGVTEAHLARAKTRFLADDTYSRDDLFFSAYRLGVWLSLGGAADQFDSWRAELETITTADVMRVAKQYLKHPATVGYLAADEGQF